MAKPNTNKTFFKQIYLLACIAIVPYILEYFTGILKRSKRNQQQKTAAATLNTEYFIKQTYSTTIIKEQVWNWSSKNILYCILIYWGFDYIRIVECVSLYYVKI